MKVFVTIFLLKEEPKEELKLERKGKSNEEIMEELKGAKLEDIEAFRKSMNQEKI